MRVPHHRPSPGLRLNGLSLASCLGLLTASGPQAAGVSDPLPPDVTSITVRSNQSQLKFRPYPAAERYRVLGAPEVTGPYAEDLSGSLTGFTWTAGSSAPAAFFRVAAVPVSSDDLLTATVLNRLAYGPTPDELARVRAMGADAFIHEQLTPEQIHESLEDDRLIPLGEWRQVTVTGTATSSTNFYVYLTAPGEVFLDDLRLVQGTNLAVGANLIRNGDFEAPLTHDWQWSTNFAASDVSTVRVHSGVSSLRLVATTSGNGQSNSVWQGITTAPVSGQLYTLSFWYYAPSHQPTSLLIRQSGASATHQLYAAADASVPLRTRLEAGWASLADLRAWHIQHAVKSQRQLVEVLAQFLENHFVTQHAKSRAFLDQYYDDGGWMDRYAARMEWVENRRWRSALLNPQVTFHDLARISAESPAMILYLDTVASRGDGGRVANENYARELFELFCQGVDNGYDQADIVEMSRVWTGWRVRRVDEAEEFNPFALQTTRIWPGSTNASPTTISNLAGVWAFSYQSNYHNPSNKVLFAGKTIPARFGPPYTTRLYGTNTVPGLYQQVIRGRTGTNGVEEGYEALATLADLPFTQEYLSVKLCRLFVHDQFAHGVYDYTDPNLSAEGRLVKACMAAWDGAAPRGQLRRVLQVIFSSELFRGHGGSLHKVKTPLEYTVSAIRALRAASGSVGFTAEADPAGVSSALGRMGSMSLFDRGDPDGYPEDAPGWVSAGTLAERLRFVQSFCIAPGGSGRGDSGNSVCQPAALLKVKLAPQLWNDAGAVVDLFLGFLYPAEGRANLDELRTAALRYLNTADNGATASPFSGLLHTTTGYDTRVRGMVAMLLSSPRFQEQ